MATNRWRSIWLNCWGRVVLTSPSVRRFAVPAAVVSLLGIHAGLLAYSATTHSPTHLEPAHLAAGVSHWQLRHFDLYRVNPPLPRMVAALPVLAIGCKTDWHRLSNAPGARSEFLVGDDLIKANGKKSLQLFVYARWCCIPFSLIGGLFTFLWARDLYGNSAGLISTTIWCFEPNTLGHAALINGTSAYASSGVIAGYFFSKWISHPSWPSAATSGIFLGIALLTKLSWLLFVCAWPILWICCVLIPHRYSEYRYSKSQHPTTSFAATVTHQYHCLDSAGQYTHRQVGLQLLQLICTLMLSIFIVNAGYFYHGTMTPLSEYSFVSTRMTGLSSAGLSGNRFAETLLGLLPIPLPKDYVLGIDTQLRDFEKFDMPSYLRGRWADSGWWYYYLYGMLVKLPCGVIAIIVWIVTFRLYTAWTYFRYFTLHGIFRHREFSPLDICTGTHALHELPLVLPAAILFAMVSSQTEFNRHLRYVYPAISFGIVFSGQIVSLPAMAKASSRFVLFVLLTHIVATSLSTYPHHISYFNELAGGATYGHRHLLGSSFDIGQDLLYVRNAMHRSSNPTYIASASGCYPRDIELPAMKCPESVLQALAEGAPVDGPNGTYFISIACIAQAPEDYIASFRRVGSVYITFTIPKTRSMVKNTMINID